MAKATTQPIKRSPVLRPRITEKATLLAECNVYSFEIPADSTKAAIKSFIKATYSVTPAKVAIVRLPAKKIFARGKRGATSAVKKAYVYLKKGDKIEFI